MLVDISRALEKRDDMEGHGDRVATLAEPVARHLGWDQERIDVLRAGAPLHDVGKVAVRSEVLRKPGPLTADEFAEVRVHPRAGASLILPLRSARRLFPYVFCHHERWDGSGYPCGLSGKSIPVEARLLAIADAFDAMTSARPYRDALGMEEALDEIAQCAGSQFDPALASLFVSLWEASGENCAA